MRYNKEHYEFRTYLCTPFPHISIDSHRTYIEMSDTVYVSTSLASIQFHYALSYPSSRKIIHVATKMYIPTCSWFPLTNFNRDGKRWRCMHSSTNVFFYLISLWRATLPFAYQKRSHKLMWPDFWIWRYEFDPKNVPNFQLFCFYTRTTNLYILRAATRSSLLLVIQ